MNCDVQVVASLEIKVVGLIKVALNGKVEVLVTVNLKLKVQVFVMVTTAESKDTHYRDPRAS